MFYFQATDTLLSEPNNLVVTTKKRLTDSPPPYESPPDYHSLPPEVLMNARELEEMCPPHSSRKSSLTSSCSSQLPQRLSPHSSRSQSEESSIQRWERLESMACSSSAPKDGDLPVRSRSPPLHNQGVESNETFVKYSEADFLPFSDSVSDFPISLAKTGSNELDRTDCAERLKPEPRKSLKKSFKLVAKTPPSAVHLRATAPLSLPPTPIAREFLHSQQPTQIISSFAAEGSSSTSTSLALCRKTRQKCSGTAQKSSSPAEVSLEKVQDIDSHKQSKVTDIF